MVIINMMSQNIAIYGAVVLLGVAGIVWMPVAAAQSGAEPISISKSDFHLSVDDVMESVARVESLAEVSNSTAEYARAYDRLQNDLGKVRPPVAEWNESDKERLRSLAEPSESAWQALEAEQQRAAERRNARAEARQREREQLMEAQREQQQTQTEEQRRQAEAELQRARIEELEARTDYYDNNSPGYYTGTWWWPSHGHRRHRRNLDFGLPSGSPIYPHVIPEQPRRTRINVPSTRSRTR